MSNSTQKIVEALQNKRMDEGQLLEAGFKLHEIADATRSGHISANIFGVYSPTIGG